MTTRTLDRSASSDATDSSQSPKGLGEDGRRKWFALSRKIAQTEKNRELLILAVGAWEDWLAACRDAKAATIDGTGGTRKTNPALDAKINAGKFYRQLLRDIDWTDGKPDDDTGDTRPQHVDD